MIKRFPHPIHEYYRESYKEDSPGVYPLNAISAIYFVFE